MFLRGTLARLVVLFAVVPAACTAPSAAPTPAQPQRPANIVFVLADDLDTSLLRFMPHVRQMQAQGVSFTNYSVADTLCCPSRASIFTGQYPHNTGVFTNQAPDGGFPAFRRHGEQLQTFATRLQRAGYQTAMMGKYLNGYFPVTPNGRRQTYVPPGWDEWAVGGDAYSEFDYDLNENGTITHHGHTPRDYLTDVLANRATHFIGRQAATEQPFLLEVATFAPHAPYTPAPRHADDFPGLTAPRDPSFNQADLSAAPHWLRNQKRLTRKDIASIDRNYRKRAQAVQAVDDMVGRLRATLDRTGLADNTYVVFSSDNGYHMGQHRLLPDKRTAFTPDLFVPLIVAGPGIPGGRLVPQLTQNVDLAPTFADLAHAGPMPHADGHSLTPLMKSGPGPRTWRGASLVEHRGPNTDPADPDRPQRGAPNPPSYTAITTGTGTYVEYAGGEREYYDNRADPYQLHNAINALSPQRQADYHATLVALARCHGAGACRHAARAP